MGSGLWKDWVQLRQNIGDADRVPQWSTSVKGGNEHCGSFRLAAICCENTVAALQIVSIFLTFCKAQLSNTVPSCRLS